MRLEVPLTRVHVLVGHRKDRCRSPFALALAAATGQVWHVNELCAWRGKERYALSLPLSQAVRHQALTGYIRPMTMIIHWQTRQISIHSPLETELRESERLMPTSTKPCDVRR